MRPAIIAVTIASILLVVATHDSRAQATIDPLDFTGVWLAFADLPKNPDERRPILNATGSARVAAFEAQYGDSAPEDGSFCVPTGMPGVMLGTVGYPLEFVHSRDRVTILAEREMQTRRIYLDGRGHPENYPSMAIGHSIGQWDGNTLVVDTQLITAREYGGWPLSEQATIVERIRLTTESEVDAPVSGFIVTEAIDSKVIEVEMTITDPATLASAHERVIYYRHIADDSILEYDCALDLWLNAMDAHRVE